MRLANISLIFTQVQSKLFISVQAMFLRTLRSVNHCGGGSC